MTKTHIINHQTRILRTIGWGSIGLLGLIGLLTIFPSTTGTANAEEHTSRASQEFSVWAHPVISISLDDHVALDINPTSETKLSTVSSTIKVSTNNSSGYGIFLGMQGNTNALISDDGTSSAQISAITSNNNFTSNTWGYNLSKGSTPGTDFSAVPITSTKLPEASTTAGAENATDTYTLTFGTAIDTTLPAGAYRNSVVLSAVANPIAITSLTQLTYMQDMTPDICTNSREDSTKRLIDTRDGKSYWVAKLADGNCWMTQNLAFDLVAGKTLTPSDTSITSEWVVPSSTYHGTDQIDATSTNYTLSWNFGDYVLASPAKISETGCRVTLGESLAECSELQDVSGWQATLGAYSTDPSAPSESWTAIDRENFSYDAHYTVGNYYQFNAAMAGNGGPDVMSSPDSPDGYNDRETPGSICPKGWRLPVTGANPSTGVIYDREDSFYRLFTAYDYKFTLTESNSLAHYAENTTKDLGNGNNQNITMKPLYIVRAGIIHPTASAVSSYGRDGLLESSTAGTVGSTNNRFYLTGADAIIPNGGNHRTSAMNVRCLAK